MTTTKASNGLIYMTLQFPLPTTLLERMKRNRNIVMINAFNRQTDRQTDRHTHTHTHTIDYIEIPIKVAFGEKNDPERNWTSISSRKLLLAFENFDVVNVFVSRRRTILSPIFVFSSNGCIAGRQIWHKRHLHHNGFFSEQ